MCGSVYQIKKYMQIPQNSLDQEFTGNGQVAELHKTMTLFKNLVNFDKLLKRKFCGILRVLKELQVMIAPWQYNFYDSTSRR